MNTKFLRTRTKKPFSLLSWVLFVCLVLYTVMLFGLLYWGIISSFKNGAGTASEWSQNMGFKLPSKWYFEYYRYFFSSYWKLGKSSGGQAGIVEMFHNSFVYSIGCAFFQTLVPCLTGYACAKFNFKFLKLFPTIVVVTMVIPIVGSTASEIAVATQLGLYNHLWGLWIMKANFLGLYFLIFHGTFKALPDAYAEAAKIDGAGNFKVLTTIMLPLVKNTFLTIFLIYFIQYWNDYQIPMLYLDDYPTIFLSLYKLFSGTTPKVPADFSKTLKSLSVLNSKLAFSVIALVPTTVLFMIFHKKLLGSVTVGGIK